MDFIGIEEGRYVWVANRWHEHAKLQKVVRVTPTLIILEGPRQYNSYQRMNGYTYGRSYSMDGDHIASYATKADRKTWEAAKERQAAEALAAKRKEEEEGKLVAELNSLLPAATAAMVPFISGRKLFTIHNLTEAQVRIIAEALRNIE